MHKLLSNTFCKVNRCLVISKCTLEGFDFAKASLTLILDVDYSDYGEMVSPAVISLLRA